MRYTVVGSVASSVLGDPRTTNNIDFVCALRPEQVQSLCAALGDDFDVDQVSLQEAMRSGSSWDIFFTKAFSKIDLFAMDGSAFQTSELQRARRIQVDGRELVVLTAEDCVLSKLLWFRAGGSVSSQQWRDVLGVLRTSAGAMDRAHLNEWSTALGLESLLQKAFNEAGTQR